MPHECNANAGFRWLALALSVCGCTASAPAMKYSQSAPGEGEAARLPLFTQEPRLYDAALRALQRIQAAIGASGLALADASAASGCEPFEPGCGFELSSKDAVYCLGNPDPARACTSFGGSGKTLGIALQAELRGDELDNRLLHEFFHVITLDRAEHSRDGLFMAYSEGNERLSTGTLEAVCAHFACTRFVVEEPVVTDTVGQEPASPSTGVRP
ncbi:MAG: hypothetical protein ABI895_26715 [Deltaproteobacteria bacterium]